MQALTAELCYGQADFALRVAVDNEVGVWSRCSASRGRMLSGISWWCVYLWGNELKPALTDAQNYIHLGGYCLVCSFQLTV
jgi:hypothetical protein